MASTVPPQRECLPHSKARGGRLGDRALPSTSGVDLVMAEVSTDWQVASGKWKPYRLKTNCGPISGYTAKLAVFALHERLDNHWGTGGYCSGFYRFRSRLRSEIYREAGSSKLTSSESQMNDQQKYTHTLVVVEKPEDNEEFLPSKQRYKAWHDVQQSLRSTLKSSEPSHRLDENVFLIPLHSNLPQFAAVVHALAESRFPYKTLLLDGLLH